MRRRWTRRCGPADSCARQGNARVYADRFELRGIADAGQHQQLRRVDHAPRENDLARGVSAVRLAALHIFHAGRARAPKHDACGQRLELQREVGALERRPEVGDRGAAATAVADRRLQPAETLLLPGVVVLGERMPGARACFQERLAERIFIAVEPGRQRSVATAVGIGAALPRFLPPEIREHVRVGPAGETRYRPAVIVAAMAAHIGHRVDRGRSADHLPARHSIGREPSSGSGSEKYIQSFMRCRNNRGQPSGTWIQGLRSQPPASSSKHLDRRIFGQPIGQHAARRPCADDDVVVRIRGHGSLLRVS